MCGSVHITAVPMISSHSPAPSFAAPMPERFKRQWFGLIPKGVANRNGALGWLRQHATEGVLYMADDDNTYDLRIFEEVCLRVYLNVQLLSEL